MSSLKMSTKVEEGSALSQTPPFGYFSAHQLIFVLVRTERYLQICYQSLYMYTLVQFVLSCCVHSVPTVQLPSLMCTKSSLQYQLEKTSSANQLLFVFILLVSLSLSADPHVTLKCLMEQERFVEFIFFFNFSYSRNLVGEVC